MLLTILDFIQNGWIIQILIALVLYTIWVWRRDVLFPSYVSLSKIEHAIVPEKHENGIVYLYQYRCDARCPNTSPFCLKVETFLKYHKIPYVPVYSMTLKSREGLVPYIIYNGQEIPDSQLIISFLEKEFKVKSNLNERDAAIARAVERTIDNSVANALLYFRILKNRKGLYKYLIKIGPPPIALLLLYRIYEPIREKLEGIFVAQLPEADVKKGLELDLGSINEILGDKKYLFGDEPTPADFALFGQLVIGTYVYTDEPVRSMFKKFPKLEEFMESIMKEMYPRYSKESCF